MAEEEKKKKRKKVEACDVKEHKPNWRETHATKQDITEFLNGVILLRHNVITDKQEFRVPDMDEFDALGMTYPTGKTPLDEWRGVRMRNAVCAPVHWPTRQPGRIHRSQMTQMFTDIPRVPRPRLRGTRRTPYIICYICVSV